MDKNQKLAALVLTVVLLAACFPAGTLASRSLFSAGVQVSVDGMDAGRIPAFDYQYENNLCVSLKGLARCLAGTGKAFRPTVEKDRIDIVTGSAYSADVPLWTDDAAALPDNASYAKNALYVDGAERKYYSFILRRDKNSAYDAFFSPISLSMLLDLDIRVTEGRLEINTAAPCTVSMREVEASGYMQGVNALVTGDAATGEIFYSFCGDSAFPIASTTKLMTYFVFMDAVTEGTCSLSDTATISAEAAWLSATPDGVIPLKAGMRVPVRELLHAMLIVSSNESALALAEHAAGTQAAFVSRMNAKAAALGLTGAQFYNCHGLPVFEDQVLPAKMQNYMTAGEMFRLASALLDAYPQVTEITSVKKVRLDVLNKEAKNTNPVLYNLDSATGLKTGSTTRAGACLVTCVTAQKDGRPHNLVTVLLGAEGDVNRGLVSELASRYAMRALNDAALRDPAASIPADPELVVRRLVSLLAAEAA